MNKYFIYMFLYFIGVNGLNASIIGKIRLTDGDKNIYIFADLYGENDDKQLKYFEKNVLKKEGRNKKLTILSEISGTYLTFSEFNCCRECLNFVDELNKYSNLDVYDNLELKFIGNIRNTPHYIFHLLELLDIRNTYGFSERNKLFLDKYIPIFKHKTLNDIFDDAVDSLWGLNEKISNKFLNKWIIKTVEHLYKARDKFYKKSLVDKYKPRFNEKLDLPLAANFSLVSIFLNVRKELGEDKIVPAKLLNNSDEKYYFASFVKDQLDNDFLNRWQDQIFGSPLEETLSIEAAAGALEVNNDVAIFIRFNHVGKVVKALEKSGFKQVSKVGINNKIDFAKYILKFTPQILKYNFLVLWNKLKAIRGKRIVGIKYEPVDDLPPLENKEFSVLI